MRLNAHACPTDTAMVLDVHSDLKGEPQKLRLVMAASLMTKLPCSLEADPASVTMATILGNLLSPPALTLCLQGTRAVASDGSSHLSTAYTALDPIGSPALHSPQQAFSA